MGKAQATAKQQVGKLWCGVCCPTKRNPAKKEESSILKQYQQAGDATGKKIFNIQSLEND